MTKSLVRGVARRREKLRAALVFRHLRVLARLRADRRLLSLRYWLFFHWVANRLAPGANTLFPPFATLRGKRSAVQTAQVRVLLHDDEPGDVSLDPRTIDFLWEVLHRTEPRLIIECGAGISTLMFAQYASLTYRNGAGPWIISIEQNADHIERVRSRMSSAGLNPFVTLIHAPLDGEGNYSLDALRSADAIMSQGADLVFIDGPGVLVEGPEPPGTRARTLPDLVVHCRDGARWFLDDAFRDHELSILRQWRRAASIQILGIYPLGKGLATGKVRRGNWNERGAFRDR